MSNKFQEAQIIITCEALILILLKRWELLHEPTNNAEQQLKACTIRICPLTEHKKISSIPKIGVTKQT